MPKQEIPKKQRISSSYGRVMILVGIFFDLLPVLLVFYLILIATYGVGSAFGDLLSSAANAADICKSVGGKWDLWGGARCLGAKMEVYTAALLASGAGLGAGAAAGFFIAPTLYVFGSYAASITAFLFFTLWFLFRGVYIWSFGNSKKVVVNLFSVVVENIPLVNLLPGISLMVWRHVRIAQMEDKKKNEKNLQGFGRTMGAAKIQK